MTGSVVDQMGPREAALYLLGRSDALEVQYQAMLAKRERQEMVYRAAQHFARLPKQDGWLPGFRAWRQRSVA